MAHQMARGRLKGQRFRFIARVEATLFLAAIVGCGSTDGLNRQAISGTVTLDGQLITKGAILFEPATPESGTAVGATIRQGAFAISRRDGPIPGLYLVRVYSGSNIQARPTKGQSDRTPRPMVESFPPRYNTRTELRVRVIDRSANRFPFDLTSDGLTDIR